MAARVRTHEAGREGLLALALTAAAAISAACSQQQPTPQPAVPEPEQLPAALLAECHGRLSGFERFAAKVTVADFGTAQVLGSLPQRLRVQWPDGSIELLDGDRGVRLEDGGAGRRPLDEAATARLAALRELLDAAGLGPIRSAVRCERVGPHSYLLHQRDGTKVDLELRADALRVDRLGAVRVLAHLDTSVSHVVRIAEVAPLGRCTVRFDRIDFAWDESVFTETPAQAKPVEGEKPGVVRIGAEARPTEPVVESVRAQRWLCVDDPGDWLARSQRVQELFATLSDAGQTTAGFQGLARDGERMLLVIPFRPLDGKKAFAPPAGWDVRDVPAGRALVVYPAEGSFEQRRARGEEQLAQALRERSLQSNGLVLAQPYVHLDEPGLDAAAATAPVTRVSVILR